VSNDGWPNSEYNFGGNLVKPDFVLGIEIYIDDDKKEVTAKMVSGGEVVLSEVMGYNSSRFLGRPFSSREEIMDAITVELQDMIADLKED